MTVGTLNIVEKYTILTCCHERCGVAFGFSQDYERRRREDHAWFYCPNGHQQHYSGKNDVEQAEAEARRQREAAERLRNQLHRREEDLQRERRRHSATKGQLNKTRRRAEHAMCPVEGCKRSFANVARHVANQHPNFVPA